MLHIEDNFMTKEYMYWILLATAFKQSHHLVFTPNNGL